MLAFQSDWQYQGCSKYFLDPGPTGDGGVYDEDEQELIVEYKDIAGIHWDWKIALLFVAFALCMFCLYSFMPLVIKVTSATSVNLGILTADLYSLFFGLFLFGYKFSGLYILSFTVIMVGFILYCSTPTRTAELAESSMPPVTSIGIDNLGLKLEENLQEAHSAVL
ncbi:Solute carrier family 35 member F2, partial [Eschrichtius robustus]|nr:Solute carrier family 35 member F2 [Eschrichtius robustus]